MQLLEVVNTDRGVALGRRIALADRWLTRLRGMLGRPYPGAGEGMLLIPCRSVHMLGMRYPLDVAFLDRTGRVLSVSQALAPGFRAASAAGARAALELPAGTLEASGTVPGDRLVWQPAGQVATGSLGSHSEAVR